MRQDHPNAIGIFDQVRWIKLLQSRINKFPILKAAISPAQDFHARMIDLPIQEGITSEPNATRQQLRWTITHVNHRKVRRKRVGDLASDL